MSLSSRIDLERLGFSGFFKISELQNRTMVIPSEPGVYCVVRESLDAPVFLESGTGGRFKGTDPNVSLATLEQNWIIGPQIIYIGKASGGVNGRRGLRKRLTEYLDFGVGRPVGHKGGRFIWQLKDSDQLLVSWKIVTTSTEALESTMLRAFVGQHGQLPFANLRH